MRPEARQANSLAGNSLILGILSHCICGPLFGIAAVICGHRALAQIRRSGGAETGRGKAIAGLVLGYNSIAIPIMVWAFPALSYTAGGTVTWFQWLIGHFQ